MSSTLINFPIVPLDALKLSLQNCSYFHQKKTFLETSDMLYENGDFFIQDYKNTSVMLSTKACGECWEFEINFLYCDSKNCIGFAFAGQEFSSLDDLVRFFSIDGNKILCGDIKIQLNRPIYRGVYAGRFGFGQVFSIFKPQKSKTEQIFVRCLRSEFTSRSTIEDDLERLICLNHKNLARICDYCVVEVGDFVPSLIIIKSDAFAESLLNRLLGLKQSLNLRQYISWIYQIGKALEYLMNNEIFHRRLCPRSCLLDSVSQIKLSDFWTENDNICDKSHFCDFDLATYPICEKAIMYRDGWRYLPVETLLSNVFDSASQVWTYALLIWQIFSHCQFGNRAQFSTFIEFLENGAEDDKFYMPGHLKKSDLGTKGVKVSRQLLFFYKSCDKFPQAPAPLAKVISQCLQKNEEDRPFFDELLMVVEYEQRIAVFTGIISKFV